MNGEARRGECAWPCCEAPCQRAPGCGPERCARPGACPACGARRCPAHAGGRPTRPVFPRVSVGPCPPGRAPAPAWAAALIALGALLVLICVPVCAWPAVVGAALIALGCAALRRGR